MSLPARFQFSQGSLQDYSECRRRFRLKYILRLAWPAVITEPAREQERLMQRGERFHRLAEQLLIGLPIENLDEGVSAFPDEHLETWWNNFKKAIPPQLDGIYHVEKSLSLPFEGFRLGAKYDLILFNPDTGFTIYDWKTSHRPIRRTRLLQRMQTRVYPYVLAAAGKELAGDQSVPPENITMVYWSAGYPETSIRLPYNQDQFQKDRRHLTGLVREIASLPEDEFILTENIETCRFCVYRSLCDRGVSAGEMDSEFSEAGDFSERIDFNFDQIEGQQF